MQKIKNILILSAGKSKRFWPLDDKNLFKFLDKTLLVYQIEKFLPYVENIFIAVSENNKDLIEDIIAPYKNITLLLQKGEGQAQAIFSAAQKILGEVLIINNIDLFNEKIIFSEIIKKRNQSKLILTAKKMNDYFPGGYLKLKDEKIIEIIEKPEPEKRPSDMVRLVVDYFADFANFIKSAKKIKDLNADGAYEKILNIYLNQVKTEYINYQDYWHFLKYPWDVLSVKKFFLSKINSFIGKQVYIDKTAKIQGEVYIEEGVKIQEYAKVAGPCYIGKNSVVGNYSLLRESMIGNNSVVGGYCEVTRSYLGDNVWLHRNYIGDSVIENNVLFGAGAVLANFRFDENSVKSKVNEVLTDTNFKKLGAVIGSKVKIGVNSSIMPGVKIGSNNFIGPHVLIKEDIL